MLCQVERCRAFAAKYGYRMVVDTQTLPLSCLPAPFGDFFSMPDSGCAVSLKTSPTELQALKVRPTHPSFWRGKLHEPLAISCRRIEGTRLHEKFHEASNTACGLSWDALAARRPSSEVILVHAAHGGGGGGRQLIGAGRLVMAKAFVERCGDYWSRLMRSVEAASPYMALHVRHTDYKSPDYPRVIESMLDQAVAKQLALPPSAAAHEGPGAPPQRAMPLLVCSDSPEVIEFARAAAAARPGAVIVTADDLAGEAQWFGSGSPIHLAARSQAREQLDVYMRQLLRDLYAMSHATSLRLVVPQNLSRAAGFSNLAAFLQSHRAARDSFFRHLRAPPT
jgi:hypothetical protein